MADQNEDRYQGDRYRGERDYGREGRGFTERAGDEVRSWFGDEEAERRRRFDERARRERGRDYGPGYEQEWGDYAYRGESGTSIYGYGTEGYPRPYVRGEFTGRGPKGYQRSDARIHEDVCDRLADAPEIDASEIDVKTNNGEVTLSGSVNDRSQKRRAEDLIENVSGVREVHNNLRVTTGVAAQPTAGAIAGATRR